MSFGPLVRTFLTCVPSISTVMTSANFSVSGLRGFSLDAVLCGDQ
jgi:hypothetical protein